MADKQFPRYQYSEFIKGGGRDGQIVIRSDDKAEFEEDKKYIDTIVAKHNPVEEQKKAFLRNRAQLIQRLTGWQKKGRITAKSTGQQ